MQEKNIVKDFEKIILPHLNAAYNLARWLTKNEDDAADVMQDSCLRALKYFNGFRGDEPKAWLLTIVRNTFYSNMQKKGNNIETFFDEDTADFESGELNPESILQRNEQVKLVRDTLEKIPVEFREVIIFRELEGFSYKEIAGIVNIPIGTVMSRLARGRKLLLQLLKNSEDRHEL